MPSHVPKRHETIIAPTSESSRSTPSVDKGNPRNGEGAIIPLRGVLPAAAERFHHLLLLTHVPLFKASCWHEGQISDDVFLPHFACRAVGDVLVEAMQKHPECDLTVLCGHTHSPGEVHIRPNLLVRTGGAVYGHPYIREQIGID